MNGNKQLILIRHPFVLKDIVTLSVVIAIPNRVGNRFRDKRVWHDFTLH